MIAVMAPYIFRLQNGDIMKSYRKELFFHVSTRRAYINITPKIEDCLRESGIKEGLVLVKTKKN